MSELTPEDAKAFREDLGLHEPGLERVIRTSYTLLGLISFLTAGEDECRAWTIRRGTKAQLAAGTIHSDIQRGFIRAGVVAFDDLLAAGRGAAPPGEGQETASTLRERGLHVVAVPEQEVRTPPLLALGGAQQGDALHLKLADGPLVLRDEDLMLLVRGPILREYQPSVQIRRFQTASLEGGYRIHLHRHGDLRPVELDPQNFEVGFTVTGSSLLELLGWLEKVAPPVQVDDSFRRITPVLGQAAPPTSGVMAATASLPRAPPHSRLRHSSSRNSSPPNGERPAVLHYLDPL